MAPRSPRSPKSFPPVDPPPPSKDVVVTLKEPVVLPQDLFMGMYNEAVGVRVVLAEYEKAFWLLKTFVVGFLKKFEPRSAPLTEFLEAWENLEEFPRDLEKMKGLLTMYILSVGACVEHPADGFMGSPLPGAGQPWNGIRGTN